MNTQTITEPTPSMLKIRFMRYSDFIAVKIGIRDTRVQINVSINSGDTVWLPRNQEFIGEGSERLNEKLTQLKAYFVDIYKEKWMIGKVTADILKTAYERDFDTNVKGLSTKDELLIRKERLLNNLEDALHNKPMRAKNKLSEFESKLSEINQQIADLTDKEEKTDRRLLIKRRLPVEEKLNRVVRHRVNVFFFIRRERVSKAGLSKIYCKVSVNGVTANAFSTGVESLPQNWDIKYKAIIGDEVATAKLNSMKDGLITVYDEFRKRGRKPEPEEVIAHYFDHELEFDKKWTVADLAEAKIKDLHRRNRTKETIAKYSYLYRLFQEVVPVKLVEDVRKSHIREFQEYFKAKNYSQDYSNKCICAIYGLFELAIANEAITVNPVKSISLDWERKEDTTCLEEEEIDALKTEKWSPRLQKVVDSFLFMCYTGLHITDYLNLQNSNIKTFRGEKFIEYNRQKNKQPTVVPLGKDAKELIDKYGSIENLPRISTQKQNDYLKLVAEQIKTDKHLTNKVARKTFTDMSINNRGMSFEAVASMLGHASTKFVQVYGKVRHQRLMAEWN